MERNIYLKTVTLEEAIQCFGEKTQHRFNQLFEEVPIDQSYGRVTFEPVYARCSNPNFNASAMDGIAVISSKTHLADERNPVQLLLNEDFIYVDTGDVIEPPYDSVIMIEHVLVIDENTVQIQAASHVWEHVRMVGEDFVIGEMLLTRNHKISAVDLGALVSGGLTSIKVYKPIRVGLVPTGTEIVEVGTSLNPGNILESNSRVFAGLVMEAGSIPHRYDIVPDDRNLLRQVIKRAIKENDIVIINAGSSAGSEDYTAALIRELGEVWIHGIDIKPGKPAILGSIENVPVIGIPGYPVSAYMTFKHFVMPLIEMTQETPRYLEAILSQNIPSSLKHKEFVRVQLGYVNDKLIATPLKRGAASTMSLVKANGILTIPKSSEGYPAGSKVEVELIRKHNSPENGLVAIGSHDLIMDWIADLLLEKRCVSHLTSSHVGSLGGIMAIKRGEAHVAPIHLLDEETGIYNLKAVHDYLADMPVVIVKGIQRGQGFYTRKGELPVESFKEAFERNLNFINRQNGSGTRLLCDHLLKKEDMNPRLIRGYRTEVLTHTAVASAVLSNNADYGIGIESVAHQMGLKYTQLAQEDYDFVIPKPYFNLQQVQEFLNILRSRAFKERLEKAGGYTLSPLKFIEMEV